MYRIFTGKRCELVSVSDLLGMYDECQNHKANGWATFYEWLDDMETYGMIERM